MHPLLSYVTLVSCFVSLTHVALDFLMKLEKSLVSSLDDAGVRLIAALEDDGRADDEERAECYENYKQSRA
jgi:hypothetical protein